MYKVLIVDDEVEIRKGLRLKVEWEELGFHIIGEASNGKEAIETIEMMEVDVMLLDMNMPIMNGTALLDYCRIQFPSIRLIVITGYDDFSYARAAIRGQAKDYLLKPVMSEELENVLIRVRKSLDEDRIKYQIASDTQWQLSVLMKEMRENFVVHMVKGETSFDVQHRLSLFHLTEWEQYAVSIMTIGLAEKELNQVSNLREPQQFQLPFELLCRELASPHQNYSFVFKDSNYPSLLHIIVANDYVDEKLLIEQLKQTIRTHLHFEIVIGIGSKVTGFQQWHDAYMDALLAWNMELSYKHNRELQPEETKMHLGNQELKTIQKMLLRGELQSVAEHVTAQLADAYHRSRSRFVKCIFQYVLLLENIAHEANINVHFITPVWLRPEIALQLHTIEKAQQYIMDIAKRILKAYEQSDADQDHSIIKEAKDFIDTNYMYEITLPNLAEKYNYNPSYFSELFKQKVGISFIQYIAEVRMKQACRLLEDSNLGLGDIAELTGFSNPSYFSSRFKKIFGVSPTDYRQTISKKNDSDSPKK